MAVTDAEGTTGTVANREFLDVLGATVGALGATSIPFALIGGVASAIYGRPRLTADIDVFCRPEHALEVLAALERHGFTPEATNPAWIYKAYRGDVVVDVIFRAKNEIYFDAAMQERVQRRTFEGIEVPLVAPEDIVITKAIATDESSPAHWWDALCILALNDIDWDYLLTRARKGPNRTASLLHFALSVDLPVPVRAVRQLDDLIAHRLEG